MEIEKIEAFKVGGELFDSLEKAEKYKTNLRLSIQNFYQLYKKHIPPRYDGLKKRVPVPYRNSNFCEVYCDPLRRFFHW